MTHTYNVTGLTCSGCEAKVKSKLLALPGITQALVSKDTQSATLTMDSHIGLGTLQAALAEAGPAYKITAPNHSEATEEARSFVDTYKPILLLFGLIALVAGIAAARAAEPRMAFMQVFMAGFFLSFSFFKLLNVSAFADSYAMYDVVAKRWRGWGYIYPFIELGLGLAFAAGVAPVAVNAITLVVMSVSLIGVVQSLMNKRAIQCACLGAVFNLPMSTVTVVEDVLMIAMSAAMLVALMG